MSLGELWPVSWPAGPELMIVDATTPPLVGSPGWEYGRFPK